MKFLSILFIVLFSLASNAQERKLLGRILSAETKKPIVNAHIILIGTTRGATSNAGGFFELVVASDVGLLSVSHVGYETATLQIPKEDKFMFYLSKATTRLNTLFLGAYPAEVEPTAAQPVSPPPEGMVVVESGAVYPGGMSGFYDYLGNALAGSPALNTSTSFDVQFTIDPMGKATGIEPSYEGAINRDTLMAVFNRMTPWEPGMQNSVSVPQSFVVTISNIPWPKKNHAEVYRFMSETIRFPPLARRNGIEGLVMVRFTVRAGTLVAPQITQEIGWGCGNEVVRTISSIPPELLLKLGPPFATYLLPVTFGLGKPYKSGPLPQENGVILLERIDVTADRPR